MLVTGGLGFIGSNFIHQILEKTKSWNITNLDAESYGANPENLADIRNLEHYRFLKADLADGEVVERFVREVDLIVHFAAETHVDRSISDPGSVSEKQCSGYFRASRGRTEKQCSQIYSHLNGRGLRLGTTWEDICRTRQVGSV